ncbi:dTDP-4-dehydrorhamnose 3,5-epimerase [Candidatus Falkowbacteria bacterium CG10_big_fil_rev_8_21_14_0_10_44_15]|uniref:dTDP-4-dehydrorhamnose 3,5-epimerase n=1 Tax=Candidatus Falkowbacteria bacterium CG10_big_fil_rev_8_21_14_0_10_44_15 TaxID=1974569 RepID=A0A2H0UZ69_9BACT|nr:MAG: dTDP-4-dehydrorhamnose 3,5-epimerase [Candidatus Falkowbacteria bacterium CG10_big_fil_rev_8_21_14_0_10_44_15]
MIEGVITKKITISKDKRGWLAEFWRSDEMKNFVPVMAYVSMTKSGFVRGPHEHVYQSDCFVFVGPGSFHLHLWDARTATHRHGPSQTAKQYEILRVGEKNPTLVIVPPGVVHGYKCVSKTDGYVINIPDKLYAGEGKKEEVDEIRWESNSQSPYKIT